MTDSINFTAKYIQPTKLKVFDLKKMKFAESEASVVQIEPDKLSDISEVSHAVMSWKGDKFGKYIANRIRTEFPNPISKNSANIYAVTSQKNSFEKLDSKKIMALAEVEKEENGQVVLRYLQVKPSLSYNAIFKKVKNVGRSVLNFLKKQYNDKQIYVYSDSNVIQFYERNGFKKISDNEFIWKAEK